MADELCATSVRSCRSNLHCEVDHYVTTEAVALDDSETTALNIIEVGTVHDLLRKVDDTLFVSPLVKSV